VTCIQYYCSQILNFPCTTSFTSFNSHFKQLQFFILLIKKNKNNPNNSKKKKKKKKKNKKKI